MGYHSSGKCPRCGGAGEVVGGDGVLREWDRCWEWGSCVVRGMVKWRRVEGYGC